MQDNLIFPASAHEIYPWPSPKHNRNPMTAGGPLPLVAIGHATSAHYSSMDSSGTNSRTGGACHSTTKCSTPVLSSYAPHQRYAAQCQRALTLLLSLCGVPPFQEELGGSYEEIRREKMATEQYLLERHVIMHTVGFSAYETFALSYFQAQPRARGKRTSILNR